MAGSPVIGRRRHKKTSTATAAEAAPSTAASTILVIDIRNFDLNFELDSDEDIANGSAVVCVRLVMSPYCCKLVKL